jgi:2-succinyl-6-hydroxy-2,4-cyclohexadiene-1-carboxylate synthase
MITQMLHVNDVTLRALISGRTQPPFAGTLVLLHGFTSSAESWERFFREEVSKGEETELASVSTRGQTKGKLWSSLYESALCADSREFASRTPVSRDEGQLRLGSPSDWHNWRFIAFDLLGHGQSSVPSDPTRYTMEACQEDLLAALRRLGVSPGEAVLLGYSLGGRIACYCAFSGFFRALILESASPGLATEQERAARRRSDEALAERIESEGVAAFVDYWEQLPLFASQRQLPAAVRHAQRAQRLRNHPQGLANSLRGVGTGAQPPLYDRLQSLAIPVMLIAGELDTKFCDIARQMAAVLPRAELHIVPHAGHTVHLEQPEIFAGLIRDFCIQRGCKGQPAP